MSTQNNRILIETYLADLSGKAKPDSLADRYVTDPELKHHIQLFEAAFPNYELVSDDIIVEGDKVAVRATFRGTHQGKFFGIAPTGKSISISVMLFYRIADNKIAEHWMTADQLNLMQQLEAAPV